MSVSCLKVLTGKSEFAKLSSAPTELLHHTALYGGGAGHCCVFLHRIDAFSDTDPFVFMFYSCCNTDFVSGATNTTELSHQIICKSSIFLKAIILRFPVQFRVL